jgi:hypothetical protein
MRVTVKAINVALKRLGHDARLVKGDSYFLFTSGDTTKWLDRTVRVPTLASLTLEQWVGEFEKLRSLNRELRGGGANPEPQPASRPKRARKS